MKHQPDDPWRPYPKRPVRDEASEIVLDQALHSLQLLRAPMYYGDAGLELHALASLRAEIDARIPPAVSDARDQNITWTDIAAQIEPTTAQTRHRYQGDAPRNH
jgi:hypothetical protein